MDTRTLDAKIKEILMEHSGSTRYICNRLFLERGETAYIIPGPDKMRRVYRRLARLKKIGLVKADYPGYWSINFE